MGEGFIGCGWSGFRLCYDITSLSHHILVEEEGQDVATQREGSSQGYILAAAELWLQDLIGISHVIRMQLQLVQSV